VKREKYQPPNKALKLTGAGILVFSGRQRPCRRPRQLSLGVRRSVGVPMSLEFEWDEDKAKGNLKKHRVSFEEASSIFGDPLALSIPDPLHSEEEDRFITLGESHRRRLLVVCTTDRGDKIRIISARLASRRERKDYEEGSKK